MTAGISSFQILGWNNNFINNAIKTQMKLFSHICYKTFNDKNIDKLSNILIKMQTINLMQFIIREIQVVKRVRLL